MKFTATLLILLALIGGTAFIGCGPSASSQNSSGEKDAFDEAAYSAEWDAEQKKSAAQIGKE